MRETVIDGYRLILGDERCIMCSGREGFEGQRVEFHFMTCPKCKGTGKRGNGNCRNCKVESWQRTDRQPGQVLDYDRPYAAGPCGSCDGKQYVPMNSSSSLPRPVMAQIVDMIGVECVFREGGELSWGEQHMGILVSGGQMLMSLYSSVDYGRTWDRLRDAWRDGATSADDIDRDAATARVKAMMTTIAAEIAEHLRGDRTQACKVVSRDGVIGAKILVLLARNGYTVLTKERDDAERAAILAGVNA